MDSRDPLRTQIWKLHSYIYRQLGLPDAIAHRHSRIFSHRLQYEWSSSSEIVEQIAARHLNRSIISFF